MRYILSRVISIIILIVVVLYGFSYMKKRGRQNEIIGELKSLSSESSFFAQFTAVEARTTLVRAVGLIAEANNLGIDPEEAIERGMGLEKGIFSVETTEKATDRQLIIRKTLRSNYENFKKLGYVADFDTLQSMRNGELPPIRTGPRAGRRGEVRQVIGNDLSLGMDKVLANLEIRPAEQRKEMNDVDIAAARSLVASLGRARVIERTAEKRILEELELRKKGGSLNR